MNTLMTTSMDTSMDTSTISRRVCIQSKYLDSNLYKHIEKHLVKSTKDECSLKYGYILGINKLITVGDNHISPGTTENVFIITFSAFTLKPEIGGRVNGTVCMVFEYGILVIVLEQLKILVSASDINDYTYSEADSCYVKNDCYIRIDTPVSVEITGVKYTSENKSYSCFGKLV
jgi:DNA-directed RNA polymerase subunit E'/Rpb7